jgi:hypothetical protein
MNDHDETTPNNDLAALRALLFEAIREVKTGAMDLNRARLVNEIGKTLVDSGRLQVDYLRLTDGERADFMEPPAPALPAGITGVTVHRLKG